MNKKLEKVCVKAQKNDREKKPSFFPFKMNKKLEKVCVKAHKNDRKKKPSFFPCRVEHWSLGLGYAIAEKKKGVRVQFLSGERLTVKSRELCKITRTQL